MPFDQIQKLYYYQYQNNMSVSYTLTTNQTIINFGMELVWTRQKEIGYFIYLSRRARE